MATQTETRTVPSERDAVIKAMQSYIDGVRLGSSMVMRSGFHEAATIFGYYPGGVMTHLIQALFDWIDNNGPSPELKAEFGDIDLRESIASVHLEARDLSGSGCACRTFFFCFGLMRAGRSHRKFSTGISKIGPFTASLRGSLCSYPASVC